MRQIWWVNDVNKTTYSQLNQLGVCMLFIKARSTFYSNYVNVYRNVWSITLVLAYHRIYVNLTIKSSNLSHTNHSPFYDKTGMSSDAQLSNVSVCNKLYAAYAHLQSALFERWVWHCSGKIVFEAEPWDRIIYPEIKILNAFNSI